MSNDDAIHDDPSETLIDLDKRITEAYDRCHFQSACRHASELKRTARAARRLRPYVRALLTLTSLANELLDPEQGREAAIELIAVLESEDRARQIQPDLDMGDYESLVSWNSSCAYDNLGESTAMTHGYNSEGIHDAIAEGIEVCRRTGKLECINCFRGYAVEVFNAADDLDMALHNARQISATGNARSNFDRRWSGANHEIKILLVAGQVAAAEQVCRRAVEFIPSYHTPHLARLLIAIHRETIRLLKGDPEPAEGEEATSIPDDAIPPADEYPQHRLLVDLREALRLCLAGEPAAAIPSLTQWDTRLSQRGCLKLWFEVRLRLIAAYRMVGDDRRVEALARPLEHKARDARDWLTLRRLARLLDRSVPVVPTAPSGPLILRAAPEADSPEPVVEAADGSNERIEVSEPVVSPLSEAIDALVARMDAEKEPDDDARDAILASMLAIDPKTPTDPADVAKLLHLARILSANPQNGPRLWAWAEEISAPFPRDAAVLSFLGTLGDSLRTAEGSLLADAIDPRRIDALFKSSLDLDPKHARNFNRAAIHYYNEGRFNEAERCLARVLRLDRGNAWAAHWLAEIYRGSDRPQDAMAVLDLTLRAGSESPELAWEALLLAHSLGRHEALLTYADRYEVLAPGQPWVNYYRTLALLDLDRAEEALTAIDEEERRAEASQLQANLLKACAASALKREDDFRTHLKNVLAIRLSEVNSFTKTGLVNLFEKLWNAAAGLPENDASRDALAILLLATGLAPNSLFEEARKIHPRAEGLGFFVCNLDQPLDATWNDSTGCLSGESAWRGYRIAWGVLAHSETEAGERALQWQARCGVPLPATIREIQAEGGDYHDHPGVVWQGLRSPWE